MKSKSHPLVVPLGKINLPNTPFILNLNGTQSKTGQPRNGKEQTQQSGVSFAQSLAQRQWLGRRMNNPISFISSRCNAKPPPSHAHAS